MKRNALVVILLICYISGFAQKNEKKYLSGTGYNDAVKWEFYCTAGNNSGRWTTILVPSCWELQGFGKYNYGLDKNPAEEQGKYRHYFSIPSNWRERAIYLVFEGVMTDAEVRVNEQQVGPIHQGAFYTFKYDITDFLRYGQQNLLEVTVSKRSADESINSAERQADYWVFGGIYRPVYIEARPYEHIERIALDARGDGNITVDVFLKNISVSTSVVARITTLDGNNLGAPFSKPLKRGQTTETLTTQRHQPYLWTAETPNRFGIEIELKSGSRTIHQVVKKFGFRTIEVRPGRGLYINGQMVKLRGINRHCFWPESGRTLSRDINLGDVNLIKNMNMNAVRMSHYPPDEHFLDVCDSLGLYVLDELAGWQTSYAVPIGEKLVKELVTRDVNHPCVIFWDNGNEGGWNVELDDDFAAHDPQKRLVLHPWELYNGINTTHYQTFEQYKKLAENGPDILLPTEIWHGLYDGGHAAG
ncbi:glycoside hydrolase family 2, partial [candidate division KSB1 bacterium]|nr:glycoside hydrolase family 2 [candidate division KSB1 bacterium]